MKKSSLPHPKSKHQIAPIKLHRTFHAPSPYTTGVKRPTTSLTPINLSSDFYPKIDNTKNHYFAVQLTNNISKDPEILTVLLNYYYKRLRLCPNLTKLYISQIILTDVNIKPIISLIRSLKRLTVLSIDIKLSEGLSDRLVKKFYSKLYRLKQLKEIHIFSSSFYRYPHNILVPLFSKPTLQLRLQVAELTITRELNEKHNSTFLQNLHHFKNVKDLTLDFSRASTCNMLTSIFDKFRFLTQLHSLSLNLTGQYITSEGYQSLAKSLSASNMHRLSLIFKSSSTVGNDLAMVLQACPDLTYLKLVFLDESKLKPETLVTLGHAVRDLTELEELHLDISQSIYCNFLMRTFADALSNNDTAIERLFLKFNSQETFFKTKGITMANVRDILLALPNLKSLDLQCINSQGVGDRIGDMVHGLKQLRDLEYFSFYLHCCPLSDYSMRMLLQALGKKKQLKGLNLALDAYRITDNSLYEMTESLKGLKTLQEVSLHMIKWRITEEALKGLGKWLVGYKKLATIEVTFQDTCSEKVAQEFRVEMGGLFPGHRLNVEYRR